MMKRDPHGTKETYLHKRPIYKRDLITKETYSHNKRTRHTYFMHTHMRFTHSPHLHLRPKKKITPICFKKTWKISTLGSKTWPASVGPGAQGQ